MPFCIQGTGLVRTLPKPVVLISYVYETVYCRPLAYVLGYGQPRKGTMGQNSTRRNRAIVNGMRHHWSRQTLCAPISEKKKTFVDVPLMLLCLLTFQR